MLDTAAVWAAHWGNLASVVGLAITIVGFIFTLIGLFRTASAAQQARDAARNAQDAVLFVDTVANISAATMVMEEIKRLQRECAWRLLPDRYAVLRRTLITVAATRGLTVEHTQMLQASIAQFSRLEKKVEIAIVGGGIPPNPAKLNEVVSTELDNVQLILTALKKAPRGTNG